MLDEQHPEDGQGAAGDPVDAQAVGQVLGLLEEVLPVEGVRIASPQRRGLLRGPRPLVVAVQLALVVQLVLGVVGHSRIVGRPAARRGVSRAISVRSRSPDHHRRSGPPRSQPGGPKTRL